MAAGAVEATHAGGVGDENRIGPAHEKPAFDDPDDALDPVLQARRIVDAAKIAIENAVAAVGDEGRARRMPQTGAGAEPFKRLARRLQAEGDDLHRQWHSRSEAVDHLAAVDNNGETVTRGRDDFL